MPTEYTGRNLFSTDPTYTHLIPDDTKLCAILNTFLIVHSVVFYSFALPYRSHCAKKKLCQNV